jgi:tetratricopeptide (TPR) repeat protein
MALSKLSMNLIFASIVAVLGLAATVAFYNTVRSARMVVTTAPPRLPDSPRPPDVPGEQAVLQQMIDRSPGDPDVLIRMADYYYDSGQYEKAADFYQRSLKIRYQNPNVETDLAICFHYLGQNDKSLETLDRVLAYNPGFLQARFNKGVVLIEGKKDLKGGIAIWEDLLRANPGYPHRAELEQRIEQLKSSSQ